MSAWCISASGMQYAPEAGLSCRFAVLAAHATGGLGVSWLGPACGLLYPTPISRYVAARQKDCAIYKGDPYAAIGRQSHSAPNAEASL